MTFQGVCERLRGEWFNSHGAIAHRGEPFKGKSECAAANFNEHAIAIRVNLLGNLCEQFSANVLG